MGKESSFDVVSQVDMQEIDNAHQQAVRETSQRYDLKDSGSKIELDKQGKAFTITAPSEFVLSQVLDVLNTKLVRREVDVKAVRWGKSEPAAGGAVRTVGQIVSGIEADLCRRINKDIRDAKIKVKVQIEGDKLRVISGSKDDLQVVIRFLKEQDYGIPLQYVNYR